MNHQITLPCAAGGCITLTVEEDQHRLTFALDAQDGRPAQRLWAQDRIGNEVNRCGIRQLPRAQTGNWFLFHARTQLMQGVTPEGSAYAQIHTCPIDCETGAPVPGLMFHYRLDVLKAGNAVRVRTHCTRRDPFFCEDLQWMRLQCEPERYEDWTAWGPACEGKLCEMERAQQFEEMALHGAQGWLAIVDGGRVRFEPDNPCLLPHADYNGTLFADLRMIDETRPLSFVLAFGDTFSVRVVEEVRGFVDGPQRPPVELEGERETLTSGRLNVSVAVRTDGASILALRMGEWTNVAGADMLPLFHLELLDLETRTQQTVTSERDWGRVTVRRTLRTVQWGFENPLEGRLRDFAVVVEASATMPDRIAWRVKVLNGNEGWSVLSASYPGLNVEGGDPTLLVPRDAGQLVEHPYARAHHVNGLYPSGFSFTMPVCALYQPQVRPGNGLYVAVEDPTGCRKDLSMHFFQSGQGCIDFHYPAENMYRPANAFEVPGSLVWQVFDGDWYDAAQLYRAFVQAHAQWLPACGARGREDSPAWMREVPLYIMDWMPNDNPDADPVPISIRPAQEPARDDWYQKPIKLAKALKMPFGYHLYNWHWIPFNNDFPHYFPVKEGLQAGVDAMHQYGIYVMPYVNGRLWDTHDARGEDAHFTREALAHTSKSRDGQPDLEIYASHEPDGVPVELAAMCPQSALWRKTLADIARELFETYQMDAIYIDQVAAAPVNLCCDPTHDHLPGGGDWWVKAYRLLMERLRLEKPAHCGFTTECNAEVYADGFDGFLTWVWIRSDMVPLFPTVYAGHIAMLGRNTNGYKKADEAYFRFHVAQSVVFGQQIGWINADVVDAPGKLAFLKQMVELRWKFRDFFTAGDLLRPPELLDDCAHCVTTTGMGQPDMFDAPTCLAGAWRRKADGKVLMLLIQTGDASISMRFGYDRAEYGVADAAESVYGEGQLLELNDTRATCALPGRGCLVLKFNPLREGDRS